MPVRNKQHTQGLLWTCHCPETSSG